MNKSNHSILASNSDCFVHLLIASYNKTYSFLIDSGASLSAISYKHIRNLNIPFHNQIVTINGLGGKVQTMGYVYIPLSLDGYVIHHKFFVFQSLPILSNGIIGRDFLNRFRALVDFNKNILSMNIGNNQNFILHITNNYNLNVFQIPPRSESVHFIQTEFESDCVVCSKELQDGLYLASSVASPVNGKIPIKIMNVTEKAITVSNISPSIHLLTDYNICSFQSSENNADRVKTLFSLLKLTDLNEEETASIKHICAKYANIFYLPGDKLTVTDIYTHNISLKPNVSPIFSKSYRLPKVQKDEIKRQISNMLNEGIIEPSKSDWSSPVLLVPKKLDASGQKKWRFVVDYRKLNDYIENDRYPLPDITEILESLSGSVYFTHLDLHQGYFNVKLDENCRKLTAFYSGQYQMTRMPMGLKTSPSSFSRMMNMAMSGLNNEKCLIYLDDLIVFGRNLTSHNKNLQDVFERLQKVNLKLNPSKCTFLKKQILYLGHLISNKGILPDPEKVSTIEKYPCPQNADEVKRFVAFTNYYRKFIPNFSEIAQPLNHLCRKNVLFNWDDTCQKSFEMLKKLIISPPVLDYPDFTEQNHFILQTDASNKAIGAVLSNKNGRPVAFTSRTLNKAESNYPVIEKELLAIVWAVKYFRPYLYGQYFKIRTDHKPLIYLFGMKDPSSRLMKFRLVLEEYNFDVEYVKGSDNAAADALSRICLSSKELKDLNTNINVMTRAQSRKILNNPDSSSLDMIRTDLRSDQPKVVSIDVKPRESVELCMISAINLNKLRKQGGISKENNTFCYDSNKRIIYIKYLNTESRMSRREFVNELDKFCKLIKINEICIVKKNDNKEFIKKLIEEIKSMNDRKGPRICVINNVKTIYNKDDRKVILNDFHLLPSSGHAGMRRMINNIKRYYYWPGIDKDVRNYVKRCDKCQRQKHSLPIKEPMNITTTANSAFEKVYLDLVGPFEVDNNNYSYILTLQCELTKYVEAYPLTSKKTEEVAKSFVTNFILRYGVPKEITTDRGKEFIAATFKEVCKLLQINQLNSTAYHHQSLGALEVSHKNLNSFLRIQTDNHPETWSSWLPFWSFAFNTTVHSETNFTPYELVFGKKCSLPRNLCTQVEPLYNFDYYPYELKYRLQITQKEARDNLLKSKQSRKIYYDKYTNPISYKVNDLILVKNETGNKLCPLFSGPYTVINDKPPNVEILKNNKVELVHKNRTKLYVK